MKILKPSAFKHCKFPAPLLTTVFLLFFILHSNAQNSGYMGKRLMVAASLQTNTNELMLRGERRSQDDDQLQVTSPIKYYLDPKSSFYLGYTINRRLMLGIDVNFNKLTQATFLETRNYDPGGFSYMRTYSTEESLLKTRLIGLNLKFFQKNTAIAPIGFYSELELGMINYELIDEKGTMGEKNKMLQKGSAYYIGYGLGRQQMILKNLSFNVGFDFKFLSNFDELLGDEAPEIEYSPSPGHVKVLPLNPAMKTFLSYTLNAKLGLGLMIL